MNTKNKAIASGVSMILFLCLIVLVRTVDVAAIGAAGTSIGLSTVNGAVHTLFGVSTFWYNVTSVLGVVAILVVAAFGLFGLYQLIQRKNIFAVDKEILALGGLYVVMAVVYVFFEKVIVNYRPIIMADAVEAEASFPSSHTMLICVIMGSAAMLLKKYVQDDTLRFVLGMVCNVIMAVTVIGRLICGVHWFTDILGGVLISAVLLFAYSAIIDVVE